MNPADDTIVAVSTPLSGEGGIGIVRLSGREAIPIAEKIFFSKNGKTPSQYSSHTVHYGWIKEEDNLVDEVLLTVMKAPKTYTKEDVVEISGHGGPVVLRKILELCLKNGARLAQPGEFTKRAFLNGRIDLIQAESVCSLIRLKTDYATALVANQLKGALSEKINGLRKELINLLSQIEVSIDYSEEDIDFISRENLINSLNSAIKNTEKIISAINKGKIYREGIKVAIVGKPNVGKSSLLNALLSSERAIVTDIPGTTRDVISETFSLKGIPVTIMDTAGIGTQTDQNLIYKLSEEKSKDAIKNSNIVLFVVDASSGFLQEDKDILDFISSAGDGIAGGKKTILVLNKIDLLQGVSLQGDPGISSVPFVFSCVVKCSALYKTNITELEDKIVETATADVSSLHTPDTLDTEFIGNIRQEQVLTRVSKALHDALESVSRNESYEFVALNVRAGLDSTGELVGETTTEEILDSIFSQFCVGK